MSKNDVIEMFEKVGGGRMNKNNGVTVTLPDNGMCALVKKIDGRYEIDTGRIERKDIFLSPWVKTSDRLPDDNKPVLDYLCGVYGQPST